MANRFDTESEALLNEELTEAEVRQVLERLSVEEFGGTGNATLRDVCEAANESPVSIAKLLAEIRKEAFEDRFERTFGDHEHRIGHLEKNTEKLERKTEELDQRRVGVFDGETSEELYRMAQERIRSRSVEAILATCLIGILVALALLKLVDSQPKSPEPDYRSIPWTASVPAKRPKPPPDSLVLMEPDGTITARDVNGNMRKPTPEEIKHVRELAESLKTK